MANVTLCSYFTSTFFAFPRVTRNLHLLVGISVVLTVLSAFVAFTNATVIIAVIRSMYLAKHVNNKSKISMILIVSMAVSDFVVGIIPMPLSVYQIVNNGKWYLGQTPCFFKFTSDDFLCAVSIFHVMCMAVDRYLAVCRPLVYRRLTVITAYIMVSVSWLLPALFFYWFLHYRGDHYDVSCIEHFKLCDANFDTGYRIMSSIITFYVPLLSLLVLYFFVLRAVQHFNKRKLNFRLKNLSSTRQNSRKTKCRGFKYLHNCMNSCMSILMLNECKYDMSPTLELCYSFKTTSDIFCMSSRTDFACSPVMRSRSTDTFLSSETTETAKTQDTSIILSAEKLSTSEVHNVKSIICYTADLKDDQQFSEHLKEYSQYSKDGVNETVDDSSNNSSNKYMSSSEIIPSLGRFDYIHHKKVTNISKLSPSTKNNSDVSMKTSSHLNNTKAVRTIGLMVLAFTVCWLPVSVLSLLPGFLNHTFPYTSYLVTAWLGYLNSALNPCLYCCHKSVRRAIMNLICPSMK